MLFNPCRRCNGELRQLSPEEMIEPVLVSVPAVTLSFIVPAELWSDQYRGNGKIEFSDEELICLLEILEFVSLVFDEVTSANTLGQAPGVLETKGKATMAGRLEQEAVLNFANGSVAWDQLVDTEGNSVGDTPFFDAIAGAESVRINPASPEKQIKEQKDLLQKINPGHT